MFRTLYRLACLSLVPALLQAAPAPVDSSLGQGVSALKTRGSQSCRRAAQCTQAAPRNAVQTCNGGKCGFACKSGYTWKDKKCQAASSGQATSGGTLLAAVSGHMVDAQLASNGITGFRAQSNGWNTNAIASWFRDSTNGHSWCYNEYDDSLPGFAPDVSVMLANFGGSNVRAGQAYCGLEAEVVTADGRTVNLIIMDGFDSKVSFAIHFQQSILGGLFAHLRIPFAYLIQWVRTPASIDVIYNAFGLLHGSTTNDKNTVESGVKWRLTGRRDSRYTFNSS
ncbi:BQ5605_C023g09689 [Microbotryum silenes-dioicae]|uniref:BQ5605_C023g09689 protein n=1 Tax=Microbotryum silenes-dioicae TaxID=796604 RepID=A0A2X0PKV7_9BASI|nr:BQ5605_C023g09689 [Microbotryum silenes-dioicae]